MERTKKISSGTPSLIFTSDIHLREDSPVCWVGDFDEEQWDSMLFLRRLQDQYKCPVVNAGDLFHHWKPSPYLLTRTMKYLPKMFYTIYGQHDLPQHNLDLSIKTGISTLDQAGALKVLSGWHWGQTPGQGEGGMLGPGGKIICVWHHLTYISPPFPGASGGQATQILKKYPQYDVIVTGDNHQSFYTEYEGRILVNPGCLVRQKASEMDYKPRVYLWYAETNTVEAVYLPINKTGITREHLEKKEEHVDRIEAYISKIDTDWEVGVSFENNLKEFLTVNIVKEPVKQIIYESTETK